MGFMCHQWWSMNASVCQNSYLTCLSFKFPKPLWLIQVLLSAMVRVISLWKLANATNQSRIYFSGESVLNIYQHTTIIIYF